ncbi:MAG: hypothetical protein V4633_07720 [Pseudomonadota bacterium]
MKKYLLFGLGMLLANVALAANYCGEIRGRHFGPFDYRLRASFDINIVESAHFTPEIEAGLRGNTSYLGDDLHYTLQAIPNHIRALATMAKVGLRDKTVKVAHAKYPVECYFDRAIRFTPDDGAVRAAYGNYLSALGRTADALNAFAMAVQLQPDDPTINYNAGLMYLKAKDYDKALVHAKKAYEKDFPLPGLKNKLIALGKWETAQAAQAPEAPPK